MCGKSPLYSRTGDIVAKKPYFPYDLSVETQIKHTGGISQ